MSLEVSENWLGFRDLTHELFLKEGLSIRDSTICSFWMVPDEVGMSSVEIRRLLTHRDTDPLEIRQPTFNAVVRDKVSKKDSVITNTALGRLGEVFTHSLMSPTLECYVGPKPFGVCDISDRKDGDATKATWAINVKLSLEDEVNRSFEVSPEHQASRSYVLLIMPRRLSMRLYFVTSESMTINSSGGQIVRPEELAETVKKLVSRKL